MARSRSTGSDGVSLPGARPDARFATGAGALGLMVLRPPPRGPAPDAVNLPSSALCTGRLESYATPESRPSVDQPAGTANATRTEEPTAAEGDHATRGVTTPRPIDAGRWVIRTG
jgi:hypothetical protein